MDVLADLSCKEFVEKLGSAAPTPGGGGASALVCAVGAALGSMSASLTFGKKGQEGNEEAIKAIIDEAESLQHRLLELIDEDACAFAPVIDAYKLPSDTEEDKKNRACAIERCLHDACQVPLKIMHACCEAIDLNAKLIEVKGISAISDIGCGVICCKAALRAASLNVFANTHLMKDQENALDCDSQAIEMLEKYGALAEEVFKKAEERLK